MLKFRTMEGGPAQDGESRRRVGGRRARRDPGPRPARRRGQTSLADRVEWDNHYIENWSLALDMRIVLMTLGALRTSPRDAQDAAAPPERGPAGPQALIRRRARRLSIFLLLFGMLALAIPVASLARPPSDTSAADQYVERVPTSTGSQATDPPGDAREDSRGGAGGSGGGGGNGGGGGGDDARPPALSRGAEAGLTQVSGQTARELEEIATSPELGAPARRLPRARHKPAEPSVPSALTNALRDEAGRRGTVLLVVLLVVALIAVAAAVHERRQGRGQHA